MKSGSFAKRSKRKHGRLPTQSTQNATKCHKRYLMYMLHIKLVHLLEVAALREAVEHVGYVLLNGRPRTRAGGACGGLGERAGMRVGMRVGMR